MPGVTWMSRLVGLACTCVAGISIMTPAVDRAAGIAAIRSLAIVGLLPDALRVDDGRLAGDRDRFSQGPDLAGRR